MNNRYAHRLVGHRGLMASHPENTLAGYKAAIAAGARYVECDLQLTKDKQAVVLHDKTVSRTSAERGLICNKTLAQAKQVSVHSPKLFNEKYYKEPIADLHEFLALLADNPQVMAMIELKQESIDRFDLQTFIDAVFPHCAELKAQIVIISFNEGVVAHAKKAGLLCGWVIRSMNTTSQALANQLRCDYLITNVLNIDVQLPQLFQAPKDHHWQWMLYDVVDAELAKSLMDKGVDLIETANVAKLISQLES
jgi:glycerophosphoryl diester phosphodiesterase